jgi:hypothetical protein
VALDPIFASVVDDKMSRSIVRLGDVAGRLSTLDPAMKTLKRVRLPAAAIRVSS